MEKAKLLEAVKTRLSYLSELGVDEIAASGLTRPKATAAPQEEIVRSGPSNAIKDLVGDLKGAPSKPAPEKRPQSDRRDLLGSTRISEVSKKKPRQIEIPERETKASGNGSPSEKATITHMTELPDSNESLDDIRTEIGAECKRCELCENRTQVVHSTGSETADLMVIGEAPGADEDLRGEPFVGRAGKLLTKILEAIDFERKDVFIGNINRCRPPKNRQPTLEESAMCKPFLLREIAVVRPKVIVVLGNTATKNLLDTKTGITKLRGEFQEFMGVKVMPTFHPAYLLRDPRKKREVWEDMKKVRAYINSGNE